MFNELAKPTELPDEVLDSVAGGNFLGRTGVAILSEDNSLNGLGIYTGPGNGPPDAAVYSGLATAINIKIHH